MLKPFKYGSPQNKPDENIVAATFTYRSLDSDQDEIRLLRVKPDSDQDSTIKCELIHTPLENAPPYQALSYTWGDHSGVHGVLIGSDYATVTPNLEHALRRLRPSNDREELLIWVDALCINQADIPERNIQTSKMRMIYQNAERVSIWLGSENASSRLAMDVARDLNRFSKDEISTMIQDPMQAERFLSLVYLFRRRYWWRIWVIQEVSCAKSATVYCGEDSIPWLELDNVATILQEQEDCLRKLYYNNPSFIRTLTHGGPRGLRYSQFSPIDSAPPLLDLLLSHKSKKSTDSRDKVYALVGISDTCHIFGNINYSLSRREVFAYTTRHIISTSQKLDVICVRQHDVNQNNMPSWVPDWTRPPANAGHTIIGLHHHDPPFSAAGDSLAQCSYLQDGYVLNTTGFVIGRIKAVGSGFKKRGAPTDVLPSLRAFQDWWSIIVAHKGESDSTQLAFSRIISCGNWQFDSDQICQERLLGIFALSKNRNAYCYTDTSASEELLTSEVTQVETPHDEKNQMASILSASLTMNRRRLFIASNNIAGLAPWDSEPGDIICILLGCRFPVVLRRLGEGWPYHYQLMGECYVDGMMNGEAMEALKNGMFVLENFEIR